MRHLTDFGIFYFKQILSSFKYLHLMAINRIFLNIINNKFEIDDSCKIFYNPTK